MTDRNLVIAYLNKNFEVVKKVRCTHPNPAAERAGGYLANQHISDPIKGYAIYAEIYEKDSPHIVHASIKFKPGSGLVTTTYRRSAREFENRYAVTPLLEN